MPPPLGQCRPLSKCRQGLVAPLIGTPLRGMHTLIYGRSYRSSFRRLMGWDPRVVTPCILRGEQLPQLRSADGCRRRQLPKGMTTTASAGGCSSPWGSAECRWSAQTPHRTRFPRRCLRRVRAVTDDGNVRWTTDRRSLDIGRTGAVETKDPTADTTKHPPTVACTNRFSEMSKATTRS